MARRYTAEQACKAILNDDDPGGIESADSLDESLAILLLLLLLAQK